MFKINSVILILLYFVSPFTEAQVTPQDVATTLGASETREFLFDREASNLSDAQKNELKTSVASAVSRGTIDHVKVLAWSDQSSATENKFLTKGEIALAELRGRYLQTYLTSDLKISNVEIYNMTDKPGAFANQLNKSSATITVATNGSTPFDVRAQGSKGIIMIFLKK